MHVFARTTRSLKTATALRAGAPLRLMFWTWAVYLVLFFVLTPFEYHRPIHAITVAFLTACLGAFAFGCIYGASTRARGSMPVVNQAIRKDKQLDATIYQCALLGLCGTLLVIADKVVSGEFSFSKSIGEVRMEQILDLDAGRPRTLMLLIGMATYSFSNVAVVLYLLRGEVCARATGRLVCLCWFSPAIVVALYGGRSSAVLLLVEVMATGHIRTSAGRSFLARAPFLRPVLGVYALIVTAGFLYVFASRAEAFGDTTTSEIVYEFSEKANADIAPELAQFLEDAGFLGSLVSTSLMSAAYVTHPLPELDYLLTENNDAGPFFGAYQCGYLFFKVVNVLLGIGQWNLEEELHHSGWFQTAFGAMYLDFGLWFAPLVMVCFGFVSQQLYQRAVVGESVVAGLYLTQVYAIVIGSPIHSAVCTGNFMQIMFSSLVATWLLRRKRTASMNNARRAAFPRLKPRARQRSHSALFKANNQ
jgi:hypothetical protein